MKIYLFALGLLFIILGLTGTFNLIGSLFLGVLLITWAGDKEYFD